MKGPLGESDGSEDRACRNDLVPDDLERKDAGLVQALANREAIAIEKRADWTDEVQSASERGLATRITVINEE